MKTKEQIMEENKCIHCNTNIKYNEQYDSTYCPKCKYWTERICADRKCIFCKDKPKYPE